MKSIRLVLFAMLGCCFFMATARSFAQAAPAEVLNNVLKGTEEEIIGVADAMPSDKYTFAPTHGNFKGVRTFGDQLKHVAEANFSFFSGFGVSGGQQRADIEKLTSKEDIVKALRASFAYAHAAIDTITADNALSTDIKGMDGQTTRAGIAAFSATHVMDHYGQLVVYLRMNGIVPPSSR